ncbi:hypothetical protein [Sphingomonas corticis]|uniref:Uncharacterized protein n=1 Tax=Sphingomonas corticis TaxID=2722791 RepID=A0ABX1CXT7_9SPHN|nr:hypothetical protein [Sphingomonas corticis]NJR80780.1 hypothetical protein [Sphingomonas corticis]
MTDLFHAADRAEHDAARLLLPHLASECALTRRLLNEVMAAAFGGSDADGQWTQRRSFEVLEYALALHLRARGPVLSSFDDVRALIALLDSHNRASIPIARVDERYAKAGNRHGTRMMIWNPLADWTSDDVFRAHRLLGILLHEAYTTWGSSRLSCRYCIFASLQDLEASASAPANAEVYRELVGIEARSTFPFQPTRWLADVSPRLLSAGLRSDVARAKADRDERRRLEASMPPGL